MTEFRRSSVTGHYSGAASRAAGELLDLGLIFATFTLSLSGVDLLARAVIGTSITTQQAGTGWLIGLGVWGFLYELLSLVIAGRTPGKAVVGVKVVMRDGSTLSAGPAFWRTLVKPFSAALFGVGFLLMLVQTERRALHDLVAGTAVVYDWGRRVAELPGPLSEYLARRAGDEYTAR